MFPALRRAVDEDLSGEQRTVFTAVTLHGVPGTALATALGSNRNAICKALFRNAHPARPPGSYRERSCALFRDLPGSVRPGWMICSPQILGMRGAIWRSTYWTATPKLSSTERARKAVPGVAAHLRCCEACHQDYQGLLAAVEGLRARPAREMTVMGASAAWSDQRAGFALADRIGPGADV